MSIDGQGTKWLETLPKISIAWIEWTNVTDDRRQIDRRTDRQTDRRWHNNIASVNVSSRSLKTWSDKNWNNRKGEISAALPLDAARPTKCSSFWLWSLQEPIKHLCSNFFREIAECEVQLIPLIYVIPLLHTDHLWAVLFLSCVTARCMLTVWLKW